jgi:SAM-dependent methyltransferase
LYDKNKYVRTITKKLGFSRPIELALTSARIVEYPWILRNIPSKGRILDVGSTGSQLPLMLVGLGYEVWTIDVRKYEYEDIVNNLNCVVGDIRGTNFSTSFFDIVLTVSTIEHVGLGRYGDPVDMEGDRKAVEEIRRVMKDGGVLLMTVPLGKVSIKKLHRVYDQESLMFLLRHFKIESLEYFLRTDRFWTKSSLEQVKDVNSSVSEMAIACVKAVKMQGQI